MFAYTYTGILQGTDAFSGALDRAAGENVGLYEIGQGDLALSSNYNLVFTSGVDFEINPATSTVSVGSDSNPSVFGESVTFTATVGGLLEPAPPPGRSTSSSTVDLR